MKEVPVLRGEPPLPGGIYGRWCHALLDMLDAGVDVKALKRLLRETAREI
jgi:hypothetical protein